MKTIKLYGMLKEKYGAEHELHVKNPAEAVRAMCCNYKTFRNDINSGSFHILNGDCLKKENCVTKDELRLNSDNNIIHIVPKIIGEKEGLTNIIIGAVLIGASFLIGGPAILSTILLNTGISLTAGGVYQLLSPPIDVTQGDREPSDNTRSYFNSTTNLVGQGHPIPIVYGRDVFAGSNVVSVNITAEEEAI